MHRSDEDIELARRLNDLRQEHCRQLVAAPLAAQAGADLLARLSESGALLEST